MIAVLLSLRYVMALASIGVIAASFLMFWEGLLTIWDAFAYIRTDPDQGVVTAVLQGTDKLLFGIVLVIFGCAITVGFVISPSSPWRRRLPEWMVIEGIADLKNLFFQMIIIYLVVHFVTLVAETVDTMPQWNALVLPVAILLLAAAMKIIATISPHPRPAAVKTDAASGDVTSGS
ncbi:YqhA family protein [Rhizobium mesoamericanum]|uniref:YqhA family protein n=1 Tax=Rhizobium mesoamericanum TaxID=1079800 RepID=UPI0004273297|nr:YqhA family protein [Rhizobium mesoamericanum]